MKINLAMMMMMRNKFKMVLTSNFIDVKIIFCKKSYLKKDFKNDLRIYYLILLIYGGG